MQKATLKQKIKKILSTYEIDDEDYRSITIDKIKIDNMRNKVTVSYWFRIENGDISKYDEYYYITTWDITENPIVINRKNEDK